MPFSITAGLILAFCLAADGGTPSFHAGASAVEITPPVGWRLAGSFQDEPSSRVRDPLHARALVLQQGEQRMALVICDLTGLPREVAHRARRLASQRTGIPADQIVIAATHTHGAPLFYDHRRERFHIQNLKQHGRDPAEPTLDYAALLVDRCAEAVVLAQRTAAPARIRSGSIDVPGLAFNRRFKMRDGSVRFNPGKLNPEIVEPVGPVDPTLRVVRFDHLADDRPIAALNVFAIHVAVHGGPEISADFPAVIEKRLQARFGPNFVALFGEGTAGDVNHIDVQSASLQPPETEPARIGNALAEAWLALEPNLHTADSPSLAVRSATIQAPLRPASPDDGRRARHILDQENPPAEFLEIVEAHRILDVLDARRIHGETLPMDVTTVRLDDSTALVCLPHEIFVDLGQAIARESPFPNTLVITLCNGVDFYVPTAHAYAEGGYEVVNSRVERGAGEALVEAALTQLRALAASRPSGPGG